LADVNTIYDFSQRGKRAVITGGASGIGNAVARAFAQRGAKVAIIDMNPDIEKAAADISPDVMAVKADITKTGEIDCALDKIAGRFGGIDVLCNIAGVGQSVSAEEISEGEWDNIVSVNMTALFFMCQRAGRYMIEQGTGGKIINMASQAGIVGLDMHVCYGATKAAVINITKTLAVEWGKYGITVNSVSPTVIMTPMSIKHWSGERGDNLKKLIPMGRFGTVEEAAACFVYLASDAANLITGENLVIDGGYTIQ